MTTPFAAPLSTTPPKKKSPAMLIALAVGLPCIGCSLIGACMLTLAFFPGKTLPVRDADKELMLRASDLETWMDEAPDPPVDEARATLTRTRDLFGVEEITYEFSDDATALFVNTTVTIDPKASDARTTYSVTKLGLGVGLAIESDTGMKKVERNDLFTWGDESTSYLLEMDGDPVGNAIVARKGTKTIFVIFSGIYFDDPDDLDEVLEPHLTALETWTP